MTRAFFFAAGSLFFKVSTALAGGLFGDNMVLQRDVPVPIWGQAAPGQRVVVSFAGQEKSAAANERGAWTVLLDALDANAEGRDLVINDGSRRVIRNVLVGEVWLCAGQSNMAFTVKQAANAEDEIASANDFGIRLIGNDLSDGWQVCSPETVGSFSAVAYSFAREIRRDLHVPVGLISQTIGGTEASRWTPRWAVQADRLLWNACLPRVWQAYARESVVARKKASQQAAAETKSIPWDEYSRRRMGGLYERLIEKTVPYGIRGVLWYQGEADASYPDVYTKLFMALIQSWRSAWGREELPFLFVQLPNFNTPIAGKWVRLREAQAENLVLKNTGMAVTIDIGEAENLHPPNKREVGRRLALIAKASVYNLPVVASGPVYESFSREVGQIRIKFRKDQSNLKLISNSGFVIASEDRQFVPAQVKVEGNDLIVRSEAMKAPVAVRYAWEASPVASLFNEAGLPAAPFRTDTWDYPYQGPRYASAANEGGKMRIRFESSAFGLKLAGKTSRDFQVAGPDRQFVPAKVAIEGGDLLVWSEDVPQPVAVRYAWGNDELEMSLFDQVGQNAQPFRTDDWPEM